MLWPENPFLISNKNNKLILRNLQTKTHIIIENEMSKVKNYISFWTLIHLFRKKF